MNYLPCNEIEPRNGQNKYAINASIIWLHGLGASGDDFVPVVPRLKLHESINPRFIFPDAKSKPIRYFDHQVMPAWYDFIIEGHERKVDSADLEQSIADIQALIQKEIMSGVPSDRIILAGFSQGGALAYEVALKGPFQLAGLMALSTYLPRAETLIKTSNNASLPILVCHGDRDQVVPLSLGEASMIRLKETGFNVQWLKYPMEHTVCLEQLDDISDFINGVLAT